MSSDRETMLWKVEPLSPSGTPPLIDEEWLCFDEKPAVLEGLGEESVLYEERLTRAQVASKILEELELKQWVKEESFADWLEEKIDLPIFEELPAPECGQNRAVVYPSIVKVQHPQAVQHQQHQLIVGHHHQPVDATQTLLREFESVLGDVEACHQSGVVSTLTPPQSPPPKPLQHLGLAQVQAPSSAHLLVSLQPLHPSQSFVYEAPQHQQHHEESTVAVQIHTQHQQQQQQQQPLSYTVVPALTLQQSSIEQQQQQQQQISQWTAENLSLVPLVHTNDVAHELAKVDEYVRSCAADVVGSPQDNSPSPPSPCTSSNASCISSEDSSADDPDWCFESTSSSSSTTSGRRLSTTGQARQGRRQGKPYSRPSAEDKRVRKKEQNKNAATRYRQKKKQEIKEILGEEQELAVKNEKLQSQLKDVQREIGYLKGLMRDLFKAKGLLK